MNKDATNLDSRDVYELRFQGEQAFREKMWAVLCESWFQRYVDTGATVLEVAAGHCEFINNIRASRKIAIDINADTRHYASDDVEVFIDSSEALTHVVDDSVDVVFVSNFFEHLPKPAITQTFSECVRVLKRGGKMLILQPNIRYVYRDYWMFYDHITPLDDRSLCEVAELAGLSIDQCIPRFLPYTTKSRLPQSLWLIKVYLKVPLAWRLLGGQAFVVASKT